MLRAHFAWHWHHRIQCADITFRAANRFHAWTLVLARRTAWSVCLLCYHDIHSSIPSPSLYRGTKRSATGATLVAPDTIYQGGSAQSLSSSSLSPLQLQPTARRRLR